MPRLPTWVQAAGIAALAAVFAMSFVWASNQPKSEWHDPRPSEVILFLAFPCPILYLGIRFYGEVLYSSRRKTLVDLAACIIVIFCLIPTASALACGALMPAPQRVRSYASIGPLTHPQ